LGLLIRETSSAVMKNKYSTARAIVNLLIKGF